MHVNMHVNQVQVMIGSDNVTCSELCYFISNAESLSLGGKNFNVT